MIKKTYIKELKLDTILKEGSKGFDVGRVQEWLNLNIFFSHGLKCDCKVDEDYGPKTKKAVKVFQEYTNSLEVDGEVGPDTWEMLTSSMSRAYSNEAIVESNIRDAIIAVSNRHLTSAPRELKGNEGPWVRAYMGGHDGSAWAWCVGSALQIIDQAMSIFKEKFTDYLPNTYSCDVLGNHAKKTNRLIRNKDLREMSLTDLYKTVKPGDILNISKTPTDWTHTALIISVHDNHFVTWEGNTNDEGSREGFEVCRRQRNFRKSNVDVILLKLKTD